MLPTSLLTHPGPCVVIDPDATCYRRAAAQRRQAFGHGVARIDPWDIARRHPDHRNDPPPDTLNPLDLLDPSSADLIDQAGDLASTLVLRDGSSDERDPFWNDSAELFLSTLTAFVVVTAERQERHLHTIRRLLLEPLAFSGALNLMRRSESVPPMLRRRADHLTYYVDREAASAMTTTCRHTAFLDSPRIDACTRSTSFDLRRFLAGDLDVFLCLPSYRLHAQARFLRLMACSLALGLTCGEPEEENRVLFLLDGVSAIAPLRYLQERLPRAELDAPS